MHRSIWQLVTTSIMTCRASGRRGNAEYLKNIICLPLIKLIEFCDWKGKEFMLTNWLIIFKGFTAICPMTMFVKCTIERAWEKQPWISLDLYYPCDFFFTFMWSKPKEIDKSKRTLPLWPLVTQLTCQATHSCFVSLWFYVEVYCSAACEVALLPKMLSW